MPNTSIVYDGSAASVSAIMGAIGTRGVLNTIDRGQRLLIDRNDKPVWLLPKTKITSNGVKWTAAFGGKVVAHGECCL